MSTVTVKIRRQDHPESPAYWEDFEIPYRAQATVISLLNEIRKRPLNARGEAISPVVWESSCLEEVCGSCLMIINGKARLACSALVESLDRPITLEPLTKFQVKRDLVVNRSRLFDEMKNSHLWRSLDRIDQKRENGFSPLSDEKQKNAFELSGCISCGACLEVCPQYDQDLPFVGSFLISQIRLHNQLSSGTSLEKKRLEMLMGIGGLDDCGHAQNCVKACPKDIPLTLSIASMNREVTRHAFKKFFGGG